MIKRQLKDEGHPVTVIITVFKDLFVQSYSKFVDKSEMSAQEIFKQLDQINHMLDARSPQKSPDDKGVNRSTERRVPEQE